jgi:hypothetical protein
MCLAYEIVETNALLISQVPLEKNNVAGDSRIQVFSENLNTQWLRETNYNSCYEWHLHETVGRMTNE